MKKSILYLLAASTLALTGCNDLLDKDPRDTFTNTPAFWSNANEVESYSNGFYSFYGTASSFYFNALNDDQDRKSTRLNSSHANISYAVFCLKKKKITVNQFYT